MVINKIFFYFCNSQLKVATDLGLIVFCWGDDNNSQEVIKYLKSMGIHGVIYDRMDQFNMKTDKVSIESKKTFDCFNF